jgi:hypothetical protein
MDSISDGIEQFKNYHAAMSEQWTSEHERLNGKNTSLCAYAEELSAKNHELETQLAAKDEELTMLRQERK